MYILQVFNVLLVLQCDWDDLLLVLLWLDVHKKLWYVG